VRDYVADVRRQSADIPVAIGALGPQMLALAARHAGAAALNWCTPAQIARTRELVGPSTELVMYLRVCVDDDLTAARVVLARQILGYALSTHIRSGPSGSLGYPAHFERMGFGEELAFLRTRRDAGANDDDLARMIPERLLTSFGYAGRGDDAREWLNANAVGLDIALVRVLSVRPGDPAPVRGAITAFAPRTFS
jgi:alkanesulfonate monooxygenase SsuD/methylene tetrahydromethanopterin reductase-like flavin-dependent oxidoreductase (luciferase family)